MTNILVVEDDPALQKALLHTLRSDGFSVHGVNDALCALDYLKNNAIDLVISDVQMPGMDGYELLSAIRQSQPMLPVIMITAYATVQKAVQAIQNGASDYLVKPFDVQTLIEKINHATRSVGRHQSGAPVCSDPISVQTLNLAHQVAQSEVSVLISGESGVGKEVIARYIHEHSRRHDAPFVAINCAAIPENMLEATLFGHEKGAFTGAYQTHIGKFEQADGGTLLLDEITEMDLNLQAKLLRVLQEREVERIGARKTIALNVRVIATSNRSLAEAVEQGEFREDLYYRLNVFPLKISPLRDRIADIAPLCNLLINKHAELHGRPPPSLTDNAMNKLHSYLWPGNVRELDNVLQRALILSQGTVIDAQDIHFESTMTAKPAHSKTLLRKDCEEQALKQNENNLILEVLKSCMGSRKKAAEKLGISPRTLRYKLARLKEAGIKLPEVS